ncbi:MAG: hypothetical protein Q4C00_06925 [Bacillota bacterium]|nr:hypothetical protein [Bacillota bacterium]
MNKRKSIIFILILLIVALFLSGCRERLIPENTDDAISEQQEHTTAPSPPEQSPERDTGADDVAEQEKPTETPKKNDNPAETPQKKENNNNSSQKPPQQSTTDERATDTLEIPDNKQESAGTGTTPGSNEPINTPGEGGNNNAVIENPEPENGGNAGKEDEQGGTVGTVADEYQKLLNDGIGSLYECKKGYVYFEDIADYTTVGHSSEEHKIIVYSGCYNVGESLTGNYQTVNDDWVISKNPSVIVKCVDSSILGQDITDTTQAQSVHAGIMSRPGWNGVQGVLENNILIVSKQLLDSKEGQLAIKMHIAKEAYPTLFTNIDMTTICNDLLGDTSGSIYIYGY